MHQSDGTGTCTALLEMHMASVAIVGRLWQKTFYYCKILFLQNVTEVNTLTANFTIPANCLIQNYFSYQLTLLQTYSSQMKKFTKWSYYKILTEWGQAGWENKYFPESHMACMDAWTLLCSVHSPDLKPNIYPSSPHTQSIST